MKKIKFLSKLIIQILFFISIFNVIYAKNYEKYYQEDKISNYFSGILLLNDNDYINSYKKLKQLDGLESIHLPYSRLYQYSLVNLERIDEAYKFSKNLERLYWLMTILKIIKLKQFFLIIGKVLSISS